MNGQLSELTREVRALRKEIRFFCELLLDRKPVEAKPIYPSMAEIVSHVSAALGVPEADILSRHRRHNRGLVRDARVLAFDLARNLSHFTYEEIGKHFGNRHAATILHSLEHAMHDGVVAQANNVIRAKFARQGCIGVTASRCVGDPNLRHSDTPTPRHAPKP